MAVTGLERKSALTITADGSWLLYRAWSDTGPSRLMKISPQAGSPQPVAAPNGEAVVHCPSSGSSCVASETGVRQVSFSLLDPASGRGRELAKTDLSAFPADSEWDLSPDGSSAAFVANGIIRILSLKDGVRRDLKVDGWTQFESVAWSADGNGLLASSLSPQSAILQVSRDGRAKVLWGKGFQAIRPSPDGRRLALAGRTTESNVWKIENF